MGDLPGLLNAVIPAAIPAVSGVPDLAALRAAVLPTPIGDPFFDEWPADLDARRPGEVIAARDVTGAAGQTVLTGVRQATQVKYRTADSAGRPSFATATLVVPAAPSPVPGRRPVVVNNLPIDGLGRTCNPGYRLARGPLNSPIEPTDFLPPITQLAVHQGYAVLIPDYQGPWMAYAEPYVEAHAVLDAIRAARHSFPNELGESRFGMIGYSGGAIATAAAARLAGRYAPELAPVLAGAALGGVPADYQLLSRSMPGSIASAVFLAAVLGIGRERPEILGEMNHLAQWVAASPLKDTCINTFALPGILMLPVAVAANSTSALQGVVAQHVLRETDLAGMKSVTPMLIYNGDLDPWIPPEGARALHRQQCALGATSAYLGVFGEHVVGAVTGFPGAVSWLADRLQGYPAPNGCAN